jgi:UDP-2,4-diacetamido-2,4,6-trideoxy-beta-L-altropyranose hydrolase
MAPHIAFRADASASIGAGHLSRCVTLATSLKHRGCRITFICAHGSPAVFPRVLEIADTVIELTHAAGDASAWLSVSPAVDAAATIAAFDDVAIDWLVVDHYGIDREWEQLVRTHVGHLMVIDDLADRAHDCDVLLDQNLYPNRETRYSGLVPPSCLCFLGPMYALLRDEFTATSPHVRDRGVSRLLLAFGGSDGANATSLAIDGVLQLDRDGLEVDIVIGQAHPFREQIATNCNVQGMTLHVQSSEMARLISQADLAVGAGGSSIWERSILGLPTLTIITAENQRASAYHLDAIGVSPVIGELATTTSDQIAQAVTSMANAPSRLERLSLEALAMMKDHKDTSRIVDALL